MSEENQEQTSSKIKREAVKVNGVKFSEGRQRYILCMDEWEGERDYGEFLRLSHARQREKKIHVKGDHDSGFPKKSFKVLASVSILLDFLLK